MKRITAILLIIVLCLLRMPLLSLAESEKGLPEELNNLYARSAVLMDGDTGRILYGKNENEQMPMASTTKIMTCILALEMGDLKSTVTASARAAAQPAVRLGMNTGEEFYLEDLLYALMLESFNDAAVAIAELVGGSVEGFAALMNEKAKALGCEQTYFITPNGLDESDETGIHSTTAANLAVIMRYCINESPKKDEFLKITRTAAHSFNNVSGNRSFSCVNHNAFLSMMEGALSGKTGFTSAAGYCYVGALRRDGKTFIVALLACGWPNNKGYKWSDTRKLMNYGLSNYDYREVKVGKEKDVFDISAILKPIEVENGIPDNGELTGPSCATAHLVCKKDETIRMLLSKEEEITAKYELKDRLLAPVKEGTKVGFVSYFLNEELLGEYQIVTDQNVDKLDFRWCMDKILDRFVP